MTDTTIYDDDILLWSEQQAAAIRRLRETARGLPNELDIENVAEEIESVGRSELASVESHMLLIAIHLMKLVIEPAVGSADHWRGEILVFCFNLRRRYAPSMRQRIDIEQIWREARHQVSVSHGDRGPGLVAGLPTECPISLDDLLDEPVDIDGLVERVKRLGGQESG